MKNKIIYWLFIVGLVLIANYLLWLYGKNVLVLLILIFFIFHTLYDIWVQYRKKDYKYIIKVRFLFIYLVIIIAQTMLLPYLFPTFVRTELHKVVVKGQENITFYADLEIIEPINLKGNNCLDNRVNQTDYFCNGKFVYMAYPINNNDMMNENYGLNGVVFTYKTRSFRWGKYYKEYEKYIRNVNNLMRQKEKQIKERLSP